MKISVRLDERLLAEGKWHAHATGKTLTKVIEDALRETLARPVVTHIVSVCG